jgi:hypothetical protein
MISFDLRSAPALVLPCKWRLANWNRREGNHVGHFIGSEATPPRIVANSAARRFRRFASSISLQPAESSTEGAVVIETWIGRPSIHTSQTRPFRVETTCSDFRRNNSSMIAIAFSSHESSKTTTVGPTDKRSGLAEGRGSNLPLQHHAIFPQPLRGAVYRRISTWGTAEAAGPRLLNTAAPLRRRRGAEPSITRASEVVKHPRDNHAPLTSDF